MPLRRALLLGAGMAFVATSFVLPALTIFDNTFSGAALLREVLVRHRAGFVGFSANLIVPALALMRPRLRRVEIALATIVLAAAAWLTARAVAGPVQLHSGVVLWWLGMLVLWTLVLESRRRRP